MNVPFFRNRGFVANEAIHTKQESQKVLTIFGNTKKYLRLRPSSTQSILTFDSPPPFRAARQLEHEFAARPVFFPPSLARLSLMVAAAGYQRACAASRETCPAPGLGLCLALRLTGSLRKRNPFFSV